MGRLDVAGNAAAHGQFDVGIRPSPIETTEAFSNYFLDEIGRLDGWTTITQSLHLKTTFISM
jgi:hypothetical protein